MDALNTFKRNASFTRCVKPFAVASLLGLALITSGCGEAGASKQEEVKEEVKVIPIPVEVASSTIGDISSNYTTTAVLESKEEAFVVARAAGIIEHIMVEEGDYVEKGQVLAKLDPQRYELNLRRSRADLQGIEKELAKINKVYHQKLVSDDVYDKLNAQYESAKAMLALAELDLKETTIVAPISGYIAERNAKVGNLTESFQRERMFHIVQLKELYGIVHLPEKELSKVHKDQQAKLQITALNNQDVKAFVERISPVINPETGTFKVTLRVPNDEAKLKAGMFTQVSLNYDTRENATLLPRKAMLALDNTLSVFVVNDGVAKKVGIKIGYQEDGLVEVLEGVGANEHVVITGHQNLKNNAPVEIVNI
ncbi:efflux RND transporter periplasmic adaptor subunit [Glaciecola sp. 2405UD65-10]|uniref:efflux RND transporter periplasmic adaptor subunit n=1 Tax=Glaciecola sp. 2405UD65-10 TaxID=3397244 RepID=UPI003B5D0503